MPTADDTRSLPGGVPSFVPARCEGCGLGYEVDAAGASEARPALDCGDCGCPVYLVSPNFAEPSDLFDLIESCAACVAAGAECEFHAGFAAGWDACAASIAMAIDADRQAELARPVEPPMFCTGYVPGDPDGCARCGECAELHDAAVDGGV